MHIADEYLFDDSDETNEPDYPDYTFDDSEEPEEPVIPDAPNTPVKPGYLEYDIDGSVKTKHVQPPVFDHSVYGLWHVSYSLPGYFNSHKTFRARPMAHYDIFWEMVRHTAYSLPWRFRDNPIPPCSMREFRKGIPPAKIHNFIHRHKRRFSWKKDDEESELCLKARRCKFLPNSKAKYPCHQRHICPFCLCEDSAVPLYNAINGCLERTEFSKPMLCHLTFFAPDTIRGIRQANRVTSSLLHLRDQIQNARMIERIKDKWFRLCLAGKDDSSLQAALRCLLIVDRSEIDRVIYRLDRFTGFKKSTFRAYLPEPVYVKRQTGWFYQYSQWLLRTQISTIEAYLHTRLYNTRVKL